MFSLSFSFHKTVNILLHLYLFLLPWQTRYIVQHGTIAGGYWEYGTMSLYATDAVFLLMALSFVIWLLKKDALQNPGHFSRSLIAVLCFFLFFAALSIPSALSSSLAAYSFLRLLQGVILFIILAWFPWKPKGIIFAIVLSAALQSVLAILQFSLQSIPSIKWLGISSQFAWQGGVSALETYTQRFLRAYGSFPHPNILGGFLSFSFFLVLAAQAQNLPGSSDSKKVSNATGQEIPSVNTKYMGMPQETWKSMHWFHYISGFLIVFGLMLSFSRSAWLGTSIGILFFLWCLSLQQRRNRLPVPLPLKKSILCYFGCMLLLGLIFFPLLQTRLASETRLEIRSQTERKDLMVLSWQILRGQWLSGAGIGNFTLKLAELTQKQYPSWFYQPAHNIYLLTLAEHGIFGATFLFLLLFTILSSSFKSIIRNRSPDSIARTAFLSGMLSLLVIGWFDHYLLTLYPGILLWWLGLGMIQKT